MVEKNNHNKTVTVIGAGSGGCAVASELTLRGYDVTLFNRSKERISPFIAAGGIHFVVKDEDHGIVPIKTITDSIADALAFSHRIVIAAPTTALGSYAEIMAEHITDHHQVLLTPGHTGGALNFRRRLLMNNPTLKTLIGETHTLPYICRMTDTIQVTVWSRVETLMTASLPGSRITELMESFKPLFPMLSETRSVLETSLSNQNAVMHSPGMILNAGWIEHTEGNFYYYAEGHSQAVGNVIKQIDTERLSIGNALGIPLVPFLDAFYAVGATSESNWRSGDISQAITKSEPNKLIKAPRSLDDRYIHEDFGYGLVPFRALASVAGVAVPVIDSLVRIAEAATGFMLTDEGLNADRLGIADFSREELLKFVM